MKVLSMSRTVQVLLFVVLVLGLAAFIVPRTEFYREWKFEGKSKSRNTVVHAEVVNAPAAQLVALAPPALNGFTPQTPVGFGSGDPWEPAIASDRFCHVYILYPQYGGVPGCPGPGPAGG